MHDTKSRVLIELVLLAVCVSIVALYLRSIALKDFDIIEPELPSEEVQPL